MICKIKSIILIMLSQLLSKEIKKEMLSINGLKSSKLSESTGVNHLLVDIKISKIICSV